MRGSIRGGGREALPVSYHDSAAPSKAPIPPFKASKFAVQSINPMYVWAEPPGPNSIETPLFDWEKGLEKLFTNSLFAVL